MMSQPAAAKIFRAFQPWTYARPPRGNCSPCCGDCEVPHAGTSVEASRGYRTTAVVSYSTRNYSSTRTRSTLDCVGISQSCIIFSMASSFQTSPDSHLLKRPGRGDGCCREFDSVECELGIRCRIQIAAYRLEMLMWHVKSAARWIGHIQALLLADRHVILRCTACTTNRNI